MGKARRLMACMPLPTHAPSCSGGTLWVKRDRARLLMEGPFAPASPVERSAPKWPELLAVLVGWFGGGQREDGVGDQGSRGWCIEVDANRATRVHATHMHACCCVWQLLLTRA